MRPTFGPQIPAAEITMSAGKNPLSVVTPVTLPFSLSMAITSCRSLNTAPRDSAIRCKPWTARTALANPSVGQ